MRSSLPTLAAIVAVAALMLTIVVGSQVVDDASIQHLSGTWEGEFLDEEGLWQPTTLELPGTFHAQGLEIRNERPYLNPVPCAPH